MEEGQHAGPGAVDIMPAIPEGCGCEQLCIVLDPSLEEKLCVCPIHSGTDWPSEDNVTKCNSKIWKKKSIRWKFFKFFFDSGVFVGFYNEAGWLGTPHVIGTVTAAVLVVLVFGATCFLLCKCFTIVPFSRLMETNNGFCVSLGRRR